MQNFDRIMEAVYTCMDEPIEENAFRFVLVIEGLSAFIQDYEKDGIWTAIEAVRDANGEMDTKEKWLASLYSEVGALLQHQGPANDKVVLIQQCMLLNICVSYFEDDLTFDRQAMQQVVLLVKPPPGQEAMRYYMDKQGIPFSKELIQGFLERGHAFIQ